MADGRISHWQDVYSAKSEDEVSWFQASPEPSLTLLHLVGANSNSAIVDIGAGASRLVDHLLASGYTHLSVLDISPAALSIARRRLGKKAGAVEWIVADVTQWRPLVPYDVWHDRATFHFLIGEADQRAYVERLRDALRVGGHAIIGTFAPDGPLKCSGLPVARHDASSIGALLGDGFHIVDTRNHDHITPKGAAQRFQFSTFERNA
ncbi:class I SAM-dependent methyltransferase [Mesorhizobium sp. CAU 1741]|uniref:class I SAM-dependent methyltransferase n=1 Tax=Mesorhizobium sp. CAU 1741 TaxID=3140366 RepID=UPI00325ABB18